MARKHALVIGSSAAGLCAAHVLSKHYDRVTIIEQDKLPANAGHRPGVPQSHHGHALLLSGQIDLEMLFPGIENDLVVRGARRAAFSADFAIRHQRGWAPRRHGFKPIISCSRQLLDCVMREHLARAPNVTICDNTTVSGLITHHSAARRVAGVSISSRTGGPPKMFAADLVVDASGRGSKAPGWFREIGIIPPPEEMVNPHGGYASRFYRMPAASRPAHWWWQGIWIEPSYPDIPRSGALLPIEDDGWLVTACGFGGQYPPDEELEWLAFLRNLKSPAIANAVQHAVPTSTIVSTRSLYSRLRRYDRWSPVGGFLAIGDSVCALNPLYAQGISVSAGCARRLDQILHSTKDDEVTPKFFSCQAQFVRTAWELSTGADKCWPKTECSPRMTPLTALRVHYLRWCAEALYSDPKVVVTYARVRHLMDSIDNLYKPRMVLRITQSGISCRLKGRLSAERSLDPFPPEQPLSISVS